MTVFGIFDNSKRRYTITAKTIPSLQEKWFEYYKKELDLDEDGEEDIDWYKLHFKKYGFASEIKNWFNHELRTIAYCCCTNKHSLGLYIVRTHSHNYISNFSGEILNVYSCLHEENRELEEIEVSLLKKVYLNQNNLIKT